MSDPTLPANEHPPAFNLLDEPWLPVLWRSGATAEVSLRELFARSADIVSLAEPSPPAFIALHRLLLAMTHRALTLQFGQWTDADRARWYSDGLPLPAFESYFDLWQERFWLFHPTQPFMQVAALTSIEDTAQRLKAWPVISIASSKGDTPVLFDHSVEQLAPPIPAEEALRLLIGYLQYAPPGLVQSVRTADKSGPLSNALAVVPTGANLAETLLLGLHKADGDGRDIPCWERSSPTEGDLLAKPRVATGPNDRYTRLVRAVLFERLAEPGVPRVQFLRFGAGLALADDELILDPAIPYLQLKENTVPVRFDEGRGFWRDLPCLLPAKEVTSIQPAVIGYATNLLQRRDPDGSLRVAVAGTTTAKGKPAKTVLWRLESFVLPSSALSQADTAAFIREQLATAEKTHNRLIALIARSFAAMLPPPDARTKMQRASSWKRAESGDAPYDDLSLNAGKNRCTAVYFGRAERGFAALLNSVAIGDLHAAYDAWQATVLDAARLAWTAAGDMLGPSAAALRARALTEDAFLALVRPLRPATPQSPSSTSMQPTTEEVSP
jgi:CRISPR system Cascade subunit CasA